MLSWGPVAGQRLGAACNWGIASRSSTSLAGGLWFCRTWCLWMKMKRTPYLFWKFKLAQHPLTFKNLWIIPKRCPVNSYGVEMIWASFREASLEQTSGQSLALHVPQWFGAGNLEPEAQEAVVRGLIGGEGKGSAYHLLIPSHPPWRSWNRQDMTDISWQVHVMYDNDQSMLHAVLLMHDAMWYRRNTVCKWFVFCRMISLDMQYTANVYRIIVALIMYGISIGYMWLKT